MFFSSICCFQCWSSNNQAPISQMPKLESKPNSFVIPTFVVGGVSNIVSFLSALVMGGTADAIFIVFACICCSLCHFCSLCHLEVNVSKFVLFWEEFDNESAQAFFLKNHYFNSFPMSLCLSHLCPLCHDVLRHLMMGVALNKHSHTCNKEMTNAMLQQCQMKQKSPLRLHSHGTVSDHLVGFQIHNV